MAEEQRAEGAGRVGDAEGGQRQQGGGGRVGGVEEDLREDQRGRAAVDEEVVVLQGAADPGGGRGLLRLAGRGGVVGRGGDGHGGLLRGAPTRAEAESAGPLG